MEAVCIPKREYVAKIATRRTVSSSRVLLRICKPVYRERKWFKEIIKVSSSPKNLRVDACARESARVQSFYAKFFLALKIKSSGCGKFRRANARANGHRAKVQSHECVEIHLLRYHLHPSREGKEREREIGCTYAHC